MKSRQVFRQLVQGYRILSGKEGKEEPLPIEVVKGKLEAEGVKKKPEKPEGGREIEVSDYEGIEIPKLLRYKIKLGRGEEEKERLQPLLYPLIPLRPRKGEPIFAYAKIVWDNKTQKYIYSLVEPELSEKLKDILEKIKDLLEQRLDVDFSKLKKFETREYLSKQIDELIDYFGFRIDDTEKEILRYYIQRDFLGLGKIEPLMRDDNIEDISCDGLNVPLFLFHRNPVLSSTITNISYKDSEKLDSFITRLSQLCGKTISVASPLVDGTLPDGSRLQATLATDIARRGSNFTIRKFTKAPLTPVHLLHYNTLNIRMMAYLWFLVEQGSSMLVSGGTASGKTTLLNVVSLFIRPDKKIVSIEDTAELKLPHPHWVPSVARVSISEEGEKKRGQVDLYDLLRESFRQRPDYIIVGEVRGREAYILFQQMATGHPSLATIHAENLPKLMDRLTTPPISLPPGLMGSLDLIVFLSRMRYKDRFVRRTNEIVEVVDYDSEKNKPMINKVFKWNSMKDTFTIGGKSIMLKKIQERTGMSDKKIKEELERRMLVLSWMKDRNIFDLQNVAKVINMYYNYPQRTVAMIMSQMPVSARLK